MKRRIRQDGGLGKKSSLVIVEEGQCWQCLVVLLGHILMTRPEMNFFLLHSHGSSENSSDLITFLPSHIHIRRVERGGTSLEKMVMNVGADRLIQCRTLDEEAELVLSSLFEGSCSYLWQSPDISPVNILRPFCDIPFSELVLVARELAIPMPKLDTSRCDTQMFLDSLAQNHPSVPFSLIRYRERLCALYKEHQNSPR